MVMVAALALAGGACGGDDGDATDATDVTDVTDDAAAASDASSVDENSSADDADTADDSGGSEWCEIARNLESNTLFDDIDIDDPDSVENAYNDIINLIDDAADAAPDEIKDEVELVLERAKTVFAELQDADFDMEKIDPAVFEDLEADAATERIDEYGARVCGIENDAVDDTAITVADDTGTTDGSGDDSGLDDGTTREQIITQLTGVGLTEDQATCIVDNIDDLEEFAQTGASDPTAFLNLVGTCEIDLTQLTPPAEPGG